MDQHRSRIDELLDLEWLERPHEVAAAVDIDGLILRLVLAAEAEEGRQMHDAGDAATVFRTYSGKGIGDARLIREIGFEYRIIGIATRPVATNHDIALMERAFEGEPHISRSASNQDNRRSEEPTS